MRIDLYRAPAAAAGGVPRPLAVGPAAVAGISSDLTTIRWFVAFSGIFLVVNAAAGVVGIAVLVWLSPWLGLVVAVTSVPTIIATRSLERRYSVAARRAQDQAGDLATIVEESALGIRVLKSLGRGRHTGAPVPRRRPRAARHRAGQGAAAGLAVAVDRVDAGADDRGGARHRCVTASRRGR